MAYLWLDGTVEGRSSGDTTTYQRVTFPEQSFSYTEDTRITASIASGSSQTFLPSTTFTTAVYGLIVKSDRPVTVSQGAVLVVTGKVVIILNDGATNGLATSAITIANASGVTATVEVIAVGA